MQMYNNNLIIAYCKCGCTMHYKVPKILIDKFRGKFLYTINSKDSIMI